MEDTPTKKVAAWKLTPENRLVITTPQGPVEIICTRTTYLHLRMPEAFAWTEERRETQMASGNTLGSK